MNVNKILERNRFTALCGGCGEIFHYSTIEEVIFAHQGGPNCETPCPSCSTGVLCACEYCQSLITDELKNAAASVPVVPTPSESSRPNADNAVYRHQSLKIHPDQFEAIYSDLKFHEVRNCLDRSFSVGDLIRLCEFSHSLGFSGRSITVRITNITRPHTYGLPADLCVFSFLKLTTEEQSK